VPTNALSQHILKALKARGYRPQPVRSLAAVMGIDTDAMAEFNEACSSLARRGRVLLGPKNTIMPAPPTGKAIGTFRSNPKGYAFIKRFGSPGQDDLYVSAECSGGAITGDTVLARVSKRGKRGGRMMYEGRVVEILERGRTRFVGELHRRSGGWFVVPDGNIIRFPIVVRDTGAKNGRAGDQVVVDILEFPTPMTEAVGVIAKVLGPRGEPDVETQSIIELYDLPGSFSDEVLDEARVVVAGYDARAVASGREDLRAVTIITIDPADARDFDDAISLTRHDDGTFELGVHIADVTHFVHEGGALDREARERANSVYLPGTVIPMLPELLSNGLCSLQERQARLTKSVFITYSARGKVKSTRFANTIIRSTKRLTYEQASRVLDGRPGRMGAKVRTLLADMEALARVIHARRLREGMLELDLPDAKLVFDDDGRAVDVIPADTSYSHKIIEMFMVEANEAVARKLTSLNVPFLRRVHEEPSDLSDGTLQRFLRALGHTLGDSVDRFAVQSLLKEVHGHDDAFPVHLAVLRGMNRAEYSPKQIGHFALASANYCHFTSPIRRYPDVTIHRLLDVAMQRARSGSSEVCVGASEDEIAGLGEHCSENERRAEAAERELRLVFTLQLMEPRVGEVFDAVVTGIKTVGAFVLIERFLVDALLPFDHMPDDWWDIDPSGALAFGQRTGLRIAVGDRLKVAIASVDVSTRRMGVGLAEPLPTKGRRSGSATVQQQPNRRRRSGRRTVRKKKNIPRRTGDRRARRR